MPAARPFIFSLLIFGMLIQSRLNAQPKGSSPVLYAITEQHGLSDNVITCFFQDQRGFMWIGTQDGLNVYDGSAIKIFRRESELPDNLADNAISDITGDEKGRVWIATANGLSAYYP